ncbi:MAG: translocation/assembly module TamB domain-containing protein [Saprospiraceae bacterium]|nr:translocation/assembly module TamB domain-containing protein [Saprospiraceae bacterium]
MPAHLKEKSRWRKLLRFLLYICLALLLLTTAVFYALTLPAVQQRLTKAAETFLQKKLGTKVEVGAVRVRFPTTVSLENFVLPDQQGDTLARIGKLVVSIGMWKLLNQTIELQDISLEDAGVHLHTKDSISNYDFVIRAFVADSSSTAPKDTSASPWKLQLDLVVLHLKRVDFLLQDDDAESTTQAYVGTAKTTLFKVDLKKLYFELDGFALADSDIKLIQKKKSINNGKPDPAYTILLKNGDIACSHLIYSTPERAIDANLVKTKIDQFRLRSANDLLGIQAQGIAIENSAIAYRDPEVIPTPGHLNGGDLSLSDLNAHLPDFAFQNDTLIVSANALSGNDKSGVKLHSLQASVRVTPGSIELKNVLASLNQTSLNGDILLHKNRQATFDRMQVQLRQLKGVIGDLIVVLPPQENQALSRLQDMPYEVSGNLSGWLENLQTNNIRFLAGSGTVANFSGAVQRLTEPKKLGMNLNISQLKTNRSDLVRWMSVGDMPRDSILAQPLPAYLSASGTLKGSMDSLQLSIQGTLGALQTGATFPDVDGPPLLFDLAGSMNELSNPDRMRMNLQIRQLDAPHNFFAFLAAKDLRFPDLLQASGTLRGTLAALNSDLKFKLHRAGIISQVAFKGRLNNVRTPEKLGFDVTFDGSLARQEIMGYLPDSIVNKVIRLPDFVQVDGQAKGSVRDAVGKVKLGLGKWGQIFLDGTLIDSTYQMDLVAQNLQVNQLAVDTMLRPLKTVGFRAHVSGEGFQIGKTANLQLAGKFDSLIWDNLILRDITFDGDVKGKRFSGGLQSPDERAAVRIRAVGDFTTAIPVLDLDVALNCIDMRSFGWANRPTTVCMRILSHSEGLSVDTLTAQVKIETIDLQYDTVHINPGDLTLDIKLDNRHNHIDFSSDWLQGEIKGYFSLPDLSTTITNIADQYFAVDRTAYLPPVSTDSLSVQLQLLRTEVLTTGLVPGLTKLDPVKLEGSLVGQRNYFNLTVHAPKIIYREWDVDSLNVRAYAGDTAALFVMTTPLVKRGELDFFENGILNGRFLANNTEVSFKARGTDGHDRFLLGVQALLNRKTKETRISLSPRQVIDYNEWTVDADNEIRVASGGMDIQNLKLKGNGQSIEVEGTTRKLKNNKTALDLAVDIERLNYNNFDVFVTSLFLELEGWAEAHLKIKGTSDAPQVRGKMQLHETFFRPALTNVRYQLSETPLEFTETGVILDGLTLRDPFGKTLEVNGKLSSKDWTDIQTNLSLHADRWQVLNSTRQQNPVYFGELFVSLDGTIRGPLSQPDIKLVLKTAKESSFTYVYDVATQALQHEGIVFFLPPPRKFVRPAIYDAPVNKQLFTLSASIEIDSNLTINSVINPVTGDDFRGKATGRLQLDILSNGNMTLVGRMELVRGVYNYSYQSVVKRSFDVSSGSSITWTGDIRQPELDLRARYKFKASPYPLVVNQLSIASAEETALYRRPQTFFLQTTLKGSATHPDVSFEFIYPSSETQAGLGTNFGNQQTGMVESALSNVNQDKNLLSRQVFGVLLLRNFIGESVGSISVNTGANPLQTGLTSFLTGQINALADQYLTFIDVDFATTEGSTNIGAGQAEGTTNYQLRLQKSFFEDRLTFKLSGGTSVGGNGADATSALENASVEYALTPKGNFKITVFSERGFELLNASSANLRNSGAGFILTKEFGGKKK